MKIFRIIMGMGFLGKLETALIQQGGEIIAVSPTECGTQYRVMVGFQTATTTRRQLMQYLQIRFPGAEVKVQQFGLRDVVEERAQ